MPPKAFGIGVKKERGNAMESFLLDIENDLDELVPSAGDFFWLPAARAAAEVVDLDDPEANLFLEFLVLQHPCWNSTC